MLTIPLPADEPRTSHQEIPSASQQLLQTYVTSENVTKSEILWAMKIVLSHFSFQVSADVGGLFQNIFLDSAIAKKFTCGKTKVHYMIYFGLASYFKGQTTAKRLKKQTVSQYPLIRPSAVTFRQSRWTSLCITFMRTEWSHNTLTANSWDIQLQIRLVRA